MPEDEAAPPPTEGAETWIDDLRVAAAFLTRLPMPLKSAPKPARLARTSWAFPIVGVVVGITGGLIYGTASQLGLPPLLAAIFAVGAQVVLTGGLHEDAAGDVADGLGGGASREQKLELMRDSRIGTYGALALIVIVLARIAALSALAEIGSVLTALVVAGAVSRAAMVVVMGTLPPARKDGLGAGAGRPQQRNIAIALAIAIVLSLLATGVHTGVVALLGAGIGAGGLAWIARRQVGGHTGDVLGACQQAAEVLCLCAIVATI